MNKVNRWTRPASNRVSSFASSQWEVERLKSGSPLMRLVVVITTSQINQQANYWPPIDEGAKGYVADDFASLYFH